MASPHSDMSVEDAAAVQSQLARPSAVADEAQADTFTATLNDSDAAASQDQVGEEVMPQHQEQQENESPLDFLADATASAESANVAAAGSEGGAMEETAQQQEQQQDMQTEADAASAGALDVQDGAQSSLDALLGSLAGQAEETAPAQEQQQEQTSTAAVTAEETTASAQQDESPQMQTESAPAAVADIQTEAPSAASSQMWASSLQSSDANGPVPGLTVSSDAQQASNAHEVAASASSTSVGQNLAVQEPHLSQIQQQATPSGTPTPAPASLPTSAAPSQDASQAAINFASTSSTTIPAVLASTSATSSSSKPTALATDPAVARQTASQLLEQRQQQKPQQNMSRLAKLRQRVEKDRFDGHAWLELIADATQKGDLERTREVYQGFLSAFPDNAREWIAFADLELSHGNNERVNEIFSKCLRSSTSVQLWHFYLTYIRRTNPIDRSSPERAAPARDVITKAFEFSLAHVGADLEAGAIWFDYIEFLKEADVSGTWEAQAKMDKLRQAYQRAVCIPLNNLELIWQGYDAFENNLNRATAKKFLQDRSPAYMTARAAARQLQNFMGRVSSAPVPHRPNWDSVADQTQVQVWKDMLAYEESDPMDLGDAAAVRTRVILTYKRALQQMRFFPEIWYLAAEYARKSDKPDEANTFFKSGMEANPTSLLLHYGYAESEESKGNNEECHKVYNALIERLQAEIDGTDNAMQTEIREALEEKARIEAQEKQMRQQNGMSNDYDDEIGEDVRQQERESITRAIRDTHTEHLNELRRLAANVWIMQMRFARRAEGIQAARAVFSRARKWPQVTWQVFEASAMLEMHWNKEAKIATNVFEVGLKRFSEEVGFVLRYLDFLIMTNDDGNARAVFERTVSKLPADKARPLFDRWCQYIYQYGDMSSIQKLNARLAETYPDTSGISRFVERHTYLDLNDLAYVDMGEDDRDQGREGKRDYRSLTPPAIKQEQPPQLQMPANMPMPPMPGQQMPMPGMQGMPMPPPGLGQLPPNMPIMPPQYPTQQQQQPPPMPPHEGWGRNMNMSPHQGPPSVDGSIDNDRRRSGGGGRGGNKRRRSPSPQGKRGKRGNSPPRVSRHTPPDDFPEGIPWLMSQLPSKTVFAAHGPILDWQHLMHMIATMHLPPVGGGENRGRDRSISPRRRNGMGGGGGGNGAGRRRSPDYNRRR